MLRPGVSRSMPKLALGLNMNPPKMESGSGNSLLSSLTG